MSEPPKLAKVLKLTCRCPMCEGHGYAVEHAIDCKRAGCDCSKLFVCIECNGAGKIPVWERRKIETSNGSILDWFR